MRRKLNDDFEELRRLAAEQVKQQPFFDHQWVERHASGPFTDKEFFNIIDGLLKSNQIQKNKHRELEKQFKNLRRLAKEGNKQVILYDSQWVKE